MSTSDSAPSLYLASASPRRAELLNQIGIPFQIFPVAIDESWPNHECLEDYVARLSAQKALAAAAQLPAGSVVLAADTAGICGDERLVKPLGEEDAVRMLLEMSGRAHTVSTAISVCCNDYLETLVVSSQVFFRTITEAECRRYWLSGEPYDKAGSYAIQGLAAVFVARIEGSYSGVVGLPLCETAGLLAKFNINCWQNR
jgi:septum formation protein